MGTGQSGWRARGSGAVSPARAWRRPEGRSPAAAGACGEWCRQPGTRGRAGGALPAARAGALFRGGRCGRPPPGRALLAECALGLAMSGLLPPSAGSRITACDREIGHDRDSSGKGLPTAPKALVMITVLGFLVCLGENPRGGGQRDSGTGVTFFPFKMALTSAELRRGSCQIQLNNKKQPAS